MPCTCETRRLSTMFTNTRLFHYSDSVGRHILILSSHPLEVFRTHSAVSHPPCGSIALPYKFCSPFVMHKEQIKLSVLQTFNKNSKAHQHYVSLRNSVRKLQNAEKISPSFGTDNRPSCTVTVRLTFGRHRQLVTFITF